MYLISLLINLTHSPFASHFKHTSLTLISICGTRYLTKRSVIVFIFTKTISPATLLILTGTGKERNFKTVGRGTFTESEMYPFYLLSAIQIENEARSMRYSVFSWNSMHCKATTGLRAHVAGLKLDKMEEDPVYAAKFSEKEKEQIREAHSKGTGF